MGRWRRQWHRLSEGVAALVVVVGEGVIRRLRQWHKPLEEAGAYVVVGGSIGRRRR